MNQEKLIPFTPPSIQALLYAVPATTNSSKPTNNTNTIANSIERNTVDEFLYLSRMYLGLGLDKNS
ncbi:hypothetical protein [Kaarinaea lacus]